MSMMEMVFFSPHDGFDRQVWPKMCPQFFSYTIFIKNHSLLLRQKATSNTKHWLQSAWPFCTGLKVLTIHGRLNTKITTEIIYSCIRHSQCIHQGLLNRKRMVCRESVLYWTVGVLQCSKSLFFFFFFFFWRQTMHSILLVSFTAKVRNQENGMRGMVFLSEKWGWEKYLLHMIVVKAKCIKICKALITMFGRKHAFNKW